MLNGIRAALLIFGVLGNAVADDLGFYARTHADSPFKPIVSEYPEWPNRLDVEYRGRATIKAKYRFVYDEDLPKNPQLHLLPDEASQVLLPHLIRTNQPVVQEEKTDEIWVINIDEAAVALLGEKLAKELMSGKHPRVVGEAVVVIETFNAGYTCDNPFFSTRFVEVEREAVAAASVPAEVVFGC